MKEFDVHFTIKFSDMIYGMEGKTTEEAKEAALEFIINPTWKASFLNNLKNYINSDEFEIDVTDILEIGKDI